MDDGLQGFDEEYLFFLLSPFEGLKGMHRVQDNGESNAKEHANLDAGSMEE